MATIRTPRKKKVAFYTPSKRKVSVRPDDEKVRVERSVNREKRNLKIDSINRKKKIKENVSSSESETKNSDSQVNNNESSTLEHQRSPKKRSQKEPKKGIKKTEPIKKTDSKKNTEIYLLENKIKQITNPLIRALQLENNKLLSQIQSESITGFTTEIGDENVSVVNYSAYGKFIRFKLIFSDDKTVDYELIDSNIKEELPSFLISEMSFSDTQMPKFIFNIMRVIIGRDIPEEDE